MMKQEYSKKNTGFRTDINGLRAVAILTVVLFHFGVPGFRGGFIGVDIFFVISGFLMTGIVVKGLERNSFSLIGFYMAHAKRIVPALAILCATLLAGGWFFLFGPDYKLLGAHSLYSIAFLSNIEYWKEAGYFDVASHEKWLLHTWSLAVEWQFYLLLPAVIWLTWRLAPGRRTLLYVMTLAVALSLGACIVVTKSQPGAAFFLLPTRAWEMLGGGIIFVVAGHVTLAAGLRRALVGAGLVLLGVANAIFDKESAWPGAGAILPVAATMAILLAERSSFVLDNRVAQWLGDRSYSLYLWHWPIYVALVYTELNRNVGAVMGGLAATLVVGHLSYMLIEQNTRIWLSTTGLPKAASAMALLVVVTALPALLVWRAQGAPGRLPAADELAAAETFNINPSRSKCHASTGPRSPACRFGTGTNDVLVLGDSHANALLSGVVSALANKDATVVELSYSGCPFVLGLKKTEATLSRHVQQYQCSAFIDATKTELMTKYPAAPVIIISRYGLVALGRNEAQDASEVPQVYFSKPYSEANSAYLQEFAGAITETACELAKHRPVYLMRPIPEMELDIPKTLSRRMQLGSKEDLTVSIASYKRRNDWVWAAQNAARDRCGVKILDPTPYLCGATACSGSKDGRPLYSDDDHLSEFGNKIFAPMYQEAFKDIANR